MFFSYKHLNPTDRNLNKIPVSPHVPSMPETTALPKYACGIAVPAGLP